MTAASNKGMCSSRLSPIAAPRNSARSVAMAVTSCVIHSVMQTPREKRTRHISARFLPVAIPSFAESPCKSMAIRLAIRITHSRA